MAAFFFYMLTNDGKGQPFRPCLRRERNLGFDAMYDSRGSLGTQQLLRAIKAVADRAIRGTANGRENFGRR